MKPPRSPRDRFGRWLSGLTRQLELPLFGFSEPEVPTTEPRGRATNGTRERSIVLGAGPLAYRFRRGRRRTIGLTINAEGLTVAAPRWVTLAAVEDAIRERETWIFTKLDELRRQHAAIPRVRWEDGGTIPYLGEPVRLHVTEAKSRATTRFDAAGQVLHVALPDPTPARCRARVEAWLQHEARTLFAERLAAYEPALGVAHRMLRLSSARTRWGSCSADGRILLHWRLIHFPLTAIDYVVVHELSHLKEMNHGPRFWATVAGVLPDYETARALMKAPPPEMLPEL